MPEKEHQKALKKDWVTHLSQAIEAVEHVMTQDVHEGWQMLSNGYKRSADRGLAFLYEALWSVEQEYGSLYAGSAQTVGDMACMDLVCGQFEVPNHIPDEEEILVALGHLKNNKAPGPSGLLLVDVLKIWAQSGGEMWEKVVQLVQWCIESGQVPQSFKCGALVLIPKAEQGKYHGIALLESVYKLISGLINHRVSCAVRYHDSIHDLIHPGSL